MTRGVRRKLRHTRSSHRVCHPDRSAAEWRDLVFQFLASPRARLRYVKNFGDRTLVKQLQEGNRQRSGDGRAGEIHPVIPHPPAPLKPRAQVTVCHHSQNARRRWNPHPVHRYPREHARGTHQKCSARTGKCAHQGDPSVGSGWHSLKSRDQVGTLAMCLSTFAGNRIRGGFRQRRGHRRQKVRTASPSKHCRAHRRDPEIR